MKMTTRSDIVCPKCGTTFDIETEGLFGGIFKQMLLHSILDRAKEGNATVTCGNCKHEFEANPK